MSGAIKTFRDLLVWQKAMALVTEVYRASATFPSDERFGLEQAREIERMLTSMIRKLRDKQGQSVMGAKGQSEEEQ